IPSEGAIASIASMTSALSHQRMTLFAAVYDPDATKHEPRTVRDVQQVRKSFLKLMSTNNTTVRFFRWVQPATERLGKPITAAQF
ncbi:MAG: hypothetical protein RMJ19_14240, partial [Gemmatales bacterium]|nr:hypothetical protein [Gemmatales bacterium]MDW8176831.1 hypothetical protein [Gemmatales bacterium]